MEFLLYLISDWPRAKNAPSRRQSFLGENMACVDLYMSKAEPLIFAVVHCARLEGRNKEPKHWMSGTVQGISDSVTNEIQ